MTEEEKVPYKKLEEAELKRHEKQMEEYKEQGWYTKADGTKSNAGLESKKSSDDNDEEEEEARPVVKKQSKARIANKKKKEETSELSLKEVSAKKSDGKLLFSDEDS